MKGRGDDHISVFQFLVKGAVVPILVTEDHVYMSL